MSRDSKFLRGQLASVGILLEEPTEAAVTATPSPRTSPSVDRDLIRVILTDAGAPAGDLGWLVESCPSVEDALGYRAPLREAWCIDCGGPRPIAARGECADPEHQHGFFTSNLSEE